MIFRSLESAKYAWIKKCQKFFIHATMQFAVTIASNALIIVLFVDKTLKIRTQFTFRKINEVPIARTFYILQQFSDTL